MGELRFGIAGLGTIAPQIIRQVSETDEVVVAAAADIRAEARAEFANRFRLPVFDSVEAMCRSPAIDAVWVATPNHLHVAHAVAAASAGKHVICEKPMAISLAECDRILAAVSEARVQLVLGHSKVMEPPVRAMRDVVRSGRLGRVFQIDCWLFNDWLQRPRLASELDTTLGGGIVFRQGPHLVDMVRFVAGGAAVSVRGVTGRRDPNFATEGNFTALIEFDEGVVANLTCNGYGYFDGAELTWGIDMGGHQAPIERLRHPRPRRTAPLSVEAKFGAAVNDAPARSTVPPTRMPFTGLTVVSCERGVIRQSPDGYLVYDENGCREVPIEPAPPGSPELIELRTALAAGRPAFPGAQWGRDTVEICLAIRESSGRHHDVALSSRSRQPVRPEEDRDIVGQ